MAEKKPITPEQIGQSIYEKGIQALNDIMPALGLGSIAACAGFGCYAVWKVYNGINENIKKHYDKNKKRIETAKLHNNIDTQARLLDQKLTSGFQNLELKAETNDFKTETRLASLAQELKSLDAKVETRVGLLAQEFGFGIKHLELRMENHHNRMSNDFYKSNMNQAMQKLQNKQDQLDDHSRQMMLGKYRNQVSPFFLANESEKFHQANDTNDVAKGPSKAVMDELYQNHYKDKLTPSEFEQFSQQFRSVCAAAAKNDGSMVPLLKELFAKPVVLKLLQLPKKM